MLGIIIIMLQHWGWNFYSPLMSEKGLALHVRGTERKGGYLGHISTVNEITDFKSFIHFYIF